jgi:hypothetical protein
MVRAIEGCAMSEPASRTKHSAILDRKEPGLIEKIRNTPGVRHIGTGRICATRSSRFELKVGPCARSGKSEFAFDSWLYIATGKRLITIFPIPEISQASLIENLRHQLRRTGIVVRPLYQEKESKMEHSSFAINGSGHPTSHNQETPESPALDPAVIDPDGSQWAFCELIYEGVVRVRELEAQISQLKADTIEFVNSNNPEA